MNKCYWIVVLVVTAGITSSNKADDRVVRRALDLAAPVALTADGKRIDVEGYAAPFVGDFDGDKRQDMLVGQLAGGRVRFYRNVGTDRQPRFKSVSWVQVDRRPACAPVGCVVGFTPQLVDFDGDGDTDLLTGALRSEVYLFRRNEDQTFAEAEVLENKRGEVVLRRRFPGGTECSFNSAAFVFDWDEDGDSDLLLGRKSYCWVPNEGTRQRPVFGEALPLKCAGKPIPNGPIAPCVADWDRDGRHDLIVGKGDDIVWYRNIGMRGQPMLESPSVLVSGNGLKMNGKGPPPDGLASLHAICVADFNGDGRLDLFVGDSYRDTTAKPNPKVMAAEKQRELRRRYGELLQRPNGETRDDRIKRYREAVRVWRQIDPHQYIGQTSQLHGRIWLFTRLPSDDEGGARP